MNFFKRLWTFLFGPQSKLRTEKETRLKLQQLTDQLENFSDPRQISIMKAEIRRMKWFLGEGPDFVLVPVKS